MAENRNILWASIFVDELARAGLEAVCAAPGSRHTPLMLAFAKHPRIKVYSHLDERSAAFFALGLALASQKPVATVCSSGTAGANMFPAVIEAHQSRVPLIIITADRPPELRHSGANQTIDQIKLFGDFVLWFNDLGLPEAQTPALTIRSLRTTANRAYAIANGTRKGVVHLNIPFRKPLEPIPVPEDMTTAPQGAEARKGAFTKIYSSTAKLSTEAMADLAELFQTYEKGVVIAGGGLARESAPAIQQVAEKLGYPLLSETYSHTRHSYGGLGAYEAYLGIAPSADLILRLGDVPISNALNSYIARSQPQALLQVSPSGIWSDDSHLSTHFFYCQPENLVLASETIQRSGDFRASFERLESQTWQVMEQEINTGDYFDGAAVYDVIDLLPDESTLFAGNSLAVRHVDQFGKPQNKSITVYANRGASGIDGNISSALGAGAARPDKPLVALIGDITFYHDMNGLLAVQRCGIPITLILLNNEGGGIFHRLPIKDFEPEYTQYFRTAHGLDFRHAAALYGLAYYRPESRAEFRQVFQERVSSGQSSIIEVHTAIESDEARRQAIMQAIKAVLSR